MKPVVWLCSVLLLLAGCRASYQLDNLSGTAGNARLDRQKAVYVAVPRDGSYESKPYVGSGQIVAQAVGAAFARSAPQVHVAETQGTTEEALASARKLGAGYVVVPTIAHWEQRATEWSGRPSRMAIRMTILDAATGNQISATSIEGRSRIVSFTSTSPESLL
ncbi:MAG: DUF4823 domain-containing protein, partial [Burkholderiales bacterium]